MRSYWRVVFADVLDHLQPAEDAVRRAPLGDLLQRFVDQGDRLDVRRRVVGEVRERGALLWREHKVYELVRDVRVLRADGYGHGVGPAGRLRFGDGVGEPLVLDGREYARPAVNVGQQDVAASHKRLALGVGEVAPEQRLLLE